jgi:hypothetical protein
MGSEKEFSVANAWAVDLRNLTGPSSDDSPT